jgi:outer membrane protein assembly factor BamB
MVGACNKNGYFYALKQAAPSTLAWKAHLGMDQTQEQIIFCGGSAVYDGTSLYVGANQAPNQTAPGSIYKLNPANGQTQWYTGLDNGPVIGSPSLDGAGVLAVPTYNQANSNGAVYLVNKANGTVLKKFSENFTLFAQPVFANNELLIAGANLQAFAP